MYYYVDLPHPATIIKEILIIHDMVRCWYTTYEYDSLKLSQVQETVYFTEMCMVNYKFLDTNRGDSSTKENKWSFGKVKSLQYSYVSVDHRLFQSLTSQNDGHQSTSDLQPRCDNTDNVKVQSHQQIRLITNSFTGGNEECDKMDLDAIQAPGTEASTQRKGYRATTKVSTATALNNTTHAYPSLSSGITSGYGTATNNTFVNTQTKDNLIASKPATFATTSCSNFEKLKRQDEPVVYVAPAKPQYYNKSTYTVLIRDSVRIVNTKVYSSLPLQSKFMVKERISGTNKVKLTLKSCYERLVTGFSPVASYIYTKLLIASQMLDG